MIKMDWIREYRDSSYTAAFQRACGIVSYGRIVSDNNNHQDGEEKFERTRVNGVKNGYHNNHQDGEEKFERTRVNGVKNGYHNGDVKHRLVEQCANGGRITNGHIKPPQEQNNKHKMLLSPDGVQFSILNLPLYYFFRIGALMGTEEFFFSFFPFVLWNVDSLLSRQTALVWALTMYFGQAAKDVVRWPRPASPPVVRLESEHNGEYGMPSTHAIAGTVIPCTFFLLTYDRYEISPYVCVGVVIIWSLMVGLSRLYLGVHSVSDVACGAGLSVLFIASLLPYLDKLDWYLQTHITSPFVFSITGFAMCTFLYPTSKGNVGMSRANATNVISATFGLLLASWVNYQMGLSAAYPTKGKLPVMMPSLGWLVFSMLRFIVGVLIQIVIHTIMTKVTVRVISYMAGLSAPEKRHPSVYIPAKFITYFTVGLMIGTLTPYIHRVLGMPRNGFLQELL